MQLWAGKRFVRLCRCVLGCRGGLEQSARMCEGCTSVKKLCATVYKRCKRGLELCARVCKGWKVVWNSKGC